MAFVLQPSRVLYDPFDAVAPAVENRRWVWPLVLLMVTGALAAATFALRWDPAPSTIREMSMGGNETQLTEPEIADEIQKASRVALVGGVTKAVLVTPVQYLLLTVFLMFVAWLLGRKAPFPKTFSAVMTASLPQSLAAVAFTLAALNQTVLTDDARQTLLPSSLAVLAAGLPGPWGHALGGLDFFNLWSVLLLGLGFSAASGMSRPKAIALTVFLYILYVGVFMLGLPAMMMGGGR